jgi:heavy metal sensor kinase
MKIRTRLTILFTLLFTLLLGVLRFMSYNYMENLLSQYFRGRLSDRANIAATVAFHTNDMQEEALTPFLQEIEKALRHERIAVFDEKGASVFTRGEPFHAITELIRRKTIRDGRAELKDHDTQYVFIRYFNEGKKYVVAIGANDARGIETQRQFGIFLLISFFAALAFVLVIGWWFSNRAMKPVRDITMQARTISASDLYIRLDEGNGKDELAHLAHAFNDMFDRLEASFDLEKQFIANASHELRTPLTTLEGYLDVALLKARTEFEYETVLHTALEETRRLQRVINQLLLLVRADTEFKGTPMTPLRIDEVLFQALDEIHKRFPNRKVEMNFEVLPEQGDEVSIVGNSDLLCIALTNVVENGIRYSPDETAVTIGLRLDSGRVIIVIRDKGIGISEKELEHIFQPFFRADNARQFYGHGIGLTLVQSIIHLHRGTVQVESVAGEGTAFILSFPRNGEKNI